MTRAGQCRRSSGPNRILLAEDDHEVRRTLKLLLAFSNYEVIDVASGTALVNYLSPWIFGDRKECPADAIITDIRMPGLDGLKIIEWLRANGWHCPTIVISAFGDDAVRARIAALDGVQFFDKPFQPAQLEDALARIVRP